MEENNKNKVRELGSIIQTTYFNDLTKKSLRAQSNVKHSYVPLQCSK